MPSIHDTCSPTFIAGNTAAPDTEPLPVETADDDASYSPERHHSLAGFFRHEDHARFQARVGRCIDALTVFAEKMPGVVRALEDFRRKLLDVVAETMHALKFSRPEILAATVGKIPA